MKPDPFTGDKMLIKPAGWQSKGLKGRTVAVKAGHINGHNLVVLSMGKRLTPESIGNSKKVEPVALARLSGNRRMHFTDVALSPESAVELHRLLGKTLQEAGLVHESFEESLAKRLAAFFSRLIATHIFAIYSKQVRQPL